MICLHYEDERELALAIISCARRCEELAARVLVIGSEASWDATRKAALDLDSSALPNLTFRPLPDPKRQQGADSWHAMLDVVRSAPPEASAASRRIVAWIAAPFLARNGTRSGRNRRDYHRSLVMTPLASAIICAYRRADVPQAERAALFETCDIVIDAKLLLPRCPAWLIDRTMASSDQTHAPVASLPACAVESDLHLTTFVRAEKLAVLGQMAAGVAHELGNPLSIISSSLQFLHRRFLAANDPASDFTMTALANVERMQGLLRGMLDLAAVKRVSVEPVDLREIVSEVLKFTAAECVRRGITVEASFDAALPAVSVEPASVKQIILNIVKNGLDAMVQGGGRLQVRTRLAKDVPASVVEIANNGPSIPTEVFPQLFQPFFTTKAGGTGLGVYLSRQIAREHGGDLHAENLPEGGVRFTLMLPVHRQEAHGTDPDRGR